MKAILEFSLPEDREEHEMHMNAGKFYAALWNLSEDIRQHVKHRDENETLTWDQVREWFYEKLNFVGVDL